MSTATVTFLPSRSWTVDSSIQSPRRSRLARTNSSASSTARSALVASSSMASTRVNSTGRWDL